MKGFEAKFLRKIKIRTRLILSFLILSILPIMLVGFISFYRTYHDMEKKATEYSYDISSHIVNNINYLFNDYIDKFERIALNSTILADIYNYEDLKEYRQIEVDNRIRYTLASIVGIGEGIDSIEIRSSDGERFYYSYPISMKNLSESPLINSTLDNNGIVWSISEKEVEGDDDIYIILSKKMQIQFAKEITGWALMSINRDYIDDVCRQGSQSENSYTVITDGAGTIISHPDKSRVLTQFEPEIIAYIRNSVMVGNDFTSRSTFRTKIADESVLVSYGLLYKNGWYVINIVSYPNLMQSTLMNGVLTLSMVLACILFSVLIAPLVTRSIYGPITDLQTEMEKVGKGALDIHFDHNSEMYKDELGILTAGFIDMVQRLKRLIDDVYHSKIKEKELEFLRKEAELNALQQQINPHFLYNTLETIFWDAQLKGEEEIAEMVMALGDFFRTSINKGLEYLSVEEEISNVKNYMYLQKIRFGSRFEVEWDIDESILKYKTIKLILQPIIENAIVHGIESMESGGLIVIKGYPDNRNIVFEIFDNGSGMTEDQVKELTLSINRRERDVRESIGVENVNQRIKLYFGDEYGVSIRSRKGEGTTVSVTIPSFENELHTNFPVS